MGKEGKRRSQGQGPREEGVMKGRERGGTWSEGRGEREERVW